MGLNVLISAENPVQQRPETPPQPVDGQNYALCEAFRFIWICGLYIHESVFHFHIAANLHTTSIPSSASFLSFSSVPVSSKELVSAALPFSTVVMT
jgi:hypothetical protein